MLGISWEAWCRALCATEGRAPAGGRGEGEDGRVSVVVVRGSWHAVWGVGHEVSKEVWGLSGGSGVSFVRSGRRGGQEGGGLTTSHQQIVWSFHTTHTMHTARRGW